MNKFFHRASGFAGRFLFSILFSGAIFTVYSAGPPPLTPQATQFLANRAQCLRDPYRIIDDAPFDFTTHFAMLRTNIAAQPYPGWQVASGVIEQVLPKALLVKRGQSIFYLTNYPEQSMVGVGNEVHVYARERGTNEMGGMKVMCLDFGKLANKDEIVAKIKEAAARPKAIVADQKAADSVSQEKLDKLIQFQMRQAAIGLPTAQYELGLRYLNGDGLEKQPDKARELFQKSAAQGNAEAKKQLEAMPPP